MKKLLMILVMCLMMAIGLVCLVGCGEIDTVPVGIRSIEKTDTNGSVDTYTIIYTDGTATTYTVNIGQNGVDGKDGTDGIDGKDGKDGTDGTDGKDGTDGTDGKDGNGIVRIEKTDTNGLVDTYTIYFSDNTTTTFTLTNGKDGKDGTDGTDGKDGIDGTNGKDGTTPTIEINQDGYWVINGEVSDVKAAGQDGLNGQNGQDGHTPTIEIGGNGNWFVDSVDTKAKAQAEVGKNGLSAYELYLKYHSEYSGSEEDWVNEFFRKENDLEIFVRQRNVSSYTAELNEYFDGVLGNNQVFVKSEDMRYWQKVYNEYDEETGDYYPYPTEYYYITDNNDATNPDILLSYKQRENAWYAISESSDIYSELNQCYMRHYQYNIDPTQFEQVTSTYYRAKSDCVTAVGKAFFFDMDVEHWGELNGVTQKIWRTEVFYSFELEIVSGNLKVRATSRIEDGDNGANVAYEFVLSKMGVTTLSMPEYLEEPEDGFPCDTIADCYEKAQGEEVVNLWCAVTGYMQLNDTDWNVWVTDYDERDILVVFQGFGFPYGVEVDRFLIIYGKIDIQNGLYRILVTRRVDYELQGSLDYTNPSIQDLSKITAKTENTVVDMAGVVFDKVALDGEGTVLLTDRGGHTFELRVAQNEVSFFNAMCANLLVGDEVNLENVAIAKDNIGLYACLTKQSDIELEYGLLLSYADKIIKESLSVEDALADLVVHYRGDDDRYILLDQSDYTLICEGYDSTQNGTFDVTLAYGEEEATIKLIVYLPDVRENVSYATLEETAIEKLDYVTPSLPSTGDVNILVIPIGFANTDYDKYGSEEQIKAKLETAFNDTEGKTGWYSLKDYYLAASYGKLNISANILDIYQTGVNYDLYSGETRMEDVGYMLDALAYYDDAIDYSEYDQNDDWNIDCIYLIYLAPMYDYYDADQSDLWWAYYFYTDDYESFDDTYVYGYLWMSIEFFDLPIDIEYAGYNTIDTENSLYVAINCEAVIHETGHALGLDDYYDYEDGGVKGGAGGFAMMDANQGDHDPYSKAILGWTNPTVVVDMNYQATLRSFEATGDTIILSKTNGGTYFEEYYMIAFYTPTGVNELKSDRECGLPSVPGVMVWHINATLRGDRELWRVSSVIDITKYNNGGAAYKLIDLVCGDGSTDIDRFIDYVVQDKDLFAAGSTISGLKWHDGTDVGVEIAIGEFDVSGEYEQVAISIEYN